MSICCVRGCQNDRTHEHRVKGGLDTFRKPATYIIRICKTCQKALSGKPIEMTYWRCGRLAFVNELWEESPGKTS